MLTIRDLACDLNIEKKPRGTVFPVMEQPGTLCVWPIGVSLHFSPRQSILLDQGFGGRGEAYSKPLNNMPSLWRENLFVLQK